MTAEGGVGDPAADEEPHHMRGVSRPPAFCAETSEKPETTLMKVIIGDLTAPTRSRLLLRHRPDDEHGRQGSDGGEPEGVA
ncbi:hypothetical protein [Streptomyces sp. NPDC048002]|uniref:hypothetical protein n=1 Tax=Streptomyces sp. NPDC048002 TaxID=3154344 RepID=UPI0033E5CD09